jgi:hypothetical protein
MYFTVVIVKRIKAGLKLYGTDFSFTLITGTELLENP